MKLNQLKDGYAAVLICTFIFSLTLMLDYWLPYKKVAETITGTPSYFQASWHGGGTTIFGIKTNREQIPVSEIAYEHASSGDTITITKSSVANVVRAVELHGWIYELPYSIYNGYCLFPTSLFIISLIGIIIKLRGKEFTAFFSVALILAIYIGIAIFTNRII